MATGKAGSPGGSLPTQLRGPIRGPNLGQLRRTEETGKSGWGRAVAGSNPVSPIRRSAFRRTFCHRSSRHVRRGKWGLFLRPPLDQLFDRVLAASAVLPAAWRYRDGDRPRFRDFERRSRSAWFESPLWNARAPPRAGGLEHPEVALAARGLTSEHGGSSPRRWGSPSHWRSRCCGAVSPLSRWLEDGGHLDEILDELRQVGRLSGWLEPEDAGEHQEELLTGAVDRPRAPHSRPTAPGMAWLRGRSAPHRPGLTSATPPAPRLDTRRRCTGRASARRRGRCAAGAQRTAAPSRRRGGSDS